MDNTWGVSYILQVSLGIHFLFGVFLDLAVTVAVTGELKLKFRWVKYWVLWLVPLLRMESKCSKCGELSSP